MSLDQTRCAIIGRLSLREPQADSLGRLAQAYDQRADLRSGSLFAPIQINIFNISKINTEVRGGRAPRIKRLSEYLGQSYFDYLAELPELVLLMDESHRYRASAGSRVLNELKPLLGLELTATPFTEAGANKDPGQNNLYIRLFLSGCRCVAIFGNSPAITCKSRPASNHSGSPSMLTRLF